jgi:hypothetical protein
MTHLLMSRYLLRTDGSLSVGSFSFDLALEQCTAKAGRRRGALRSLTDYCSLAFKLPAAVVRLDEVLTAFAAYAKATLTLDPNLDSPAAPLLPQPASMESGSLREASRSPGPSSETTTSVPFS